MEYLSLKTFATLSSTFILHNPFLDSLNLNIPPLVYQPNRKTIYIHLQKIEEYP